MRWTKSRYFIHSGRRYLIKSPYWLQFTFVQHNECYCLFWPFNILFLLWLVPATVTYVLFASWTLLAPPTSTLCAVVWDIPAISFQPLLQKCYRECTPLFRFWDTRWQGSVGRPLVSIRPVFFRREVSTQILPFSMIVWRTLCFSFLPPIFLLPHVYRRR